jgi:hypothetical protein
MGANERGAVHIISLMVLLLALFGAWFLYSSYQQTVMGKMLQGSVSMLQVFGVAAGHNN